MCGAISVWRFVLLFTVLVVFAVIGIGFVVNPNWGMRHFARALLGGGELRQEWNRLGLRLCGVAFGGCALYLSYVLLRGCFA